MKKKSGLFALAVVALWLFNTCVLATPSNDREWTTGMDVLPEIQVQGDTLTIRNVRDFRVRGGELPLPHYVDRSVDARDIQGVWFLFEPFSQFKEVAHTYFVFDFTNAAPLAVSVEARKVKGEQYSAPKGLFNQYELMYVWATESDQTVRRVVYEHNRLYMYPLQVPPAGLRQLLLQLAGSTQELAAHPRFYNTLLSNCTNELAKAANAVKPGAVPFNLGLIFPGYADKALYDLGYLPTDRSFNELKQHAYISDIVPDIQARDDFSAALRSKLAQH